MADDYEDFDYVPDDIENEFDYHIKNNPEQNRENKNKDLEISEGNLTNPKKTLTIEDEDKYNFENTEKKFDSKTFLNDNEKKLENEEEEDIHFDDLREEDDLDRKEINEKPALRTKELSYFESEPKKKIYNSIGKKINRKNDKYGRLVSEIPQIDQTEFTQINDSRINHVNEKFNNSVIQPDIYQSNSKKGI